MSGQLHPARQELSLCDLQDVTKLSPTITRILGQNPGPFTLQGTNTYLIAGGESSILIDTGQGMPAYVPLLESALRLNPPVSDIILTHWHRDHVQGLPSVLEAIRVINQQPGAPNMPSKPKVWKYKLPHNPSDSQDDRDLELARSCVGAAREKNELLNREGEPEPAEDQAINWVEDAQVFQIPDQYFLRVLHTPGHTDDSISCLLYDRAQALQAIFVGDTILGGSSTIFENLTAYLHSLRTLGHYLDDPATVRLYPGHGEVIEDGQEEIARNLRHRLQREQQILTVLASKPPPNPLTTEELLGCMYKAALPPQVLPAVLRGLRLHLQKLVEDGRVKEIVTGRWALIAVKNSC